MLILLFDTIALRPCGATNAAPGLVLRNRIVMPAITTGFAGPDGGATDRLRAWYRARGAGGAALVIVEPAQVSALGGLYRHRLRADTDAAIPALRRLAGTIRDGGARAAVQLNHYGSRVPRDAIPASAAGRLVSATATTLPGGRQVRALSGTEVEELIAAFGAAAGRARAAGFDAVELQAGHGNLIHQFLARRTNKRRDRYGRGPQGRLRVLRDVLAAMRAVAGEDFPIVVRMSAAELVPRGYGLERGREIARAAVAAGAAAIHVSAGIPEARTEMPLCAGVGEAPLAGLAAGIRKAIGQHVPVIAAGRILSVETAEELLSNGTADLVALGRALVADPAWPSKAQAEQTDDIWPCVGCMACQMPAVEAGIGCAVNADAGHEAEFTIRLRRTARPRRVAVWGTGVAGLAAAQVAAQCGHHVIIWSDGWPLGGLLGLRSRVPGLAEMGRAILAFGTALKRLGVPVREGTPEGADVILDARSVPERLPEWATEEKIWLAGDVLASDLRALIPLRRRIAVCGDTSVVADVALFLCGWGKRLTIITTTDDPLRDLHVTLAAHVRRRLDGYRVVIETEADPIAWQPEAGPKRLGQTTGWLTVIQRGEQRDLGPFHSVIVAPGWDENGPIGPGHLPDTIPDGGPPLLLGDSYRPDRWRDLVLYAARLARRL